jgi:hypothetical protein
MDDGLVEGSDSDSDMTDSSQVFSFSPKSASLSPERTGRSGEPDLETPASFSIFLKMEVFVIWLWASPLIL